MDFHRAKASDRPPSAIAPCMSLGDRLVEAATEPQPATDADALSALVPTPGSSCRSGSSDAQILEPQRAKTDGHVVPATGGSHATDHGAAPSLPVDDDVVW